MEATGGVAENVLDGREPLRITVQNEHALPPPAAYYIDYVDTMGMLYRDGREIKKESNGQVWALRRLRLLPQRLCFSLKCMGMPLFIVGIVLGIAGALVIHRTAVQRVNAHRL